MYQLYKQFVHQEVVEFIPLIMNTITLQPTPQQRQHKDFNKEVFVDFMGAQIKTLSFLAYIIRIYQEARHLFVKGCPGRGCEPGDLKAFLFFRMILMV
jgi:transformation/transcription domain-associated protein